LSKALLNKYYPNPEIHDIKRNKFCYIYDTTLVKLFIELEDFKKDFEKTVLRSEKGKLAANKTKDYNIEQVKKYEITVDKISMKQLRQFAINAWQDWNNDIWDNSSEEHTKRIMMNYVRHNLTHYDNYLDIQKGKIGTSEMYYVLNEIVLEKILEIYPRLG
jgi:hypothetical protein